LSHEKYGDWLEEAIDDLEAAKRLFGARRRGGSRHSWRGGRAC
jgi:HEPN domain-containing protein